MACAFPFSTGDTVDFDTYAAAICVRVSFCALPDPCSIGLASTSTGFILWDAMHGLSRYPSTWGAANTRFFMLFRYANMDCVIAVHRAGQDPLAPDQSDGHGNGWSVMQRKSGDACSRARCGRGVMEASATRGNGQPRVAPHLATPAGSACEMTSGIACSRGVSAHPDSRSDSLTPPCVAHPAASR